MSKTITLKNRINKIDNAVNILNSNLVELDKLIESLDEEIKLDEALIKRLNNGVSLDILYAELAEKYIEQVTPKPLESIKAIIRKDFADRVPTDQDTLEILRLFAGLLSWYRNETGEEAELERKFGYYQISEKQIKRLKDACKATLTDSQAKYIDLLDTYRAAAQARRDFEIANQIYGKVGDIFVSHSDDPEIILKNVI